MMSGGIWTERSHGDIQFCIVIFPQLGQTYQTVKRQVVHFLFLKQKCQIYRQRKHKERNMVVNKARVH